MFFVALLAHFMRYGIINLLSYQILPLACLAGSLVGGGYSSSRYYREICKFSLCNLGIGVEWCARLLMLYYLGEVD